MRPGDAPSSSGRLAFWPQQASPGGPTTVASPPRGFYCQLCQLECSGPQPWRQHVESARHMKMEADFKQRTGRDAAALHGSPSCSPSPSVCGSGPPSPARRPPGMESRAFFCETCQLGCSGPEPWKQHVQSAKHLKRVSLERTSAGQAPGQSPGQSPSRPGSSLSVEDVLRGCGGSPASAASPSPSPAGTYFCTFCRLSCTGIEPWKQHVQSAKHLKRKAQAELGPRGMADGVGMDGVASDSAPMEAGAVTKAVAMAEADGPTSSRSPRMDIADDTRSLPMACADSVPPVAPPPVAAAPPFSTPAAAGAGSVGDSFHCAACDVTCYGPETWRQHADSARHIKLSMTARSEGRDFTSSTAAMSSSAASAASGWVVADGVPPPTAGPPRANPYYCDVCRLSCSGPEPWKQHVQSGKHLKMAAQAGQATPAPDLHRSVSVSSTDSFVVLSGPSTGPPRSNPYYCDVCRIPCSGPEPWKQHIQSGKHLKMAQQYRAQERQGQQEQSRPPTAQSDVSSYISVPMETGEEQSPRPSINPFSPLCSGAVSDGAAETAGQTEVDGAGAELASPGSGLAAQLASPAEESTPPDSVSGRSTPSSVASSARLSGLSTPSGLGGLSSVSALRSLGGLGAVSSLPGGMYRCNVCQLDCTGPQPLQQHLNSVKHIKMLERQRSLPGMYPASSSPALPGAYATVGAAMSGGSLGAYAADVVGNPQQLDPCQSIRIGSGLHDLLDRADGISEQQSLLAGEVLRQLHPEGLVAFLEDLPLVRCNEPFSRARC